MGLFNFPARLLFSGSALNPCELKGASGKPRSIHACPLRSKFCLVKQAIIPNDTPREGIAWHTADGLFFCDSPNLIF